MAIKYLVCTNCRQVCARFDTETIDNPLTGLMFQSYMADRGVPPPWAPDLSPQWFWCVHCRRRPFAEVEPVELFVSDDLEGQTQHHYNIAAAPPPSPEPPSPQGPSPGPDSGEAGFLCELCGRSFKSAQGLAGHKRACKGGPS